MYQKASGIAGDEWWLSGSVAPPRVRGGEVKDTGAGPSAAEKAAAAAAEAAATRKDEKENKGKR